MTIEELKARCRKLVAPQLNVEPDKITDHARFARTLGADSLDFLELTIAFEEEFELLMSDDEAVDLLTFGDAVGWLAAKLPASDLADHDICSVCARPVWPLSPVRYYDDVGEVHAICGGATPDQNKAGGRIKVDPDEFSGPGPAPEYIEVYLSDAGSRSGGGMSRRKILVADLLCGAGGSSTGCGQALEQLGLQMELVCVNHWGVAIETHRRNHPEARHYVQDIATVRPHLLVPEGYLDLLMASPTCTHHSVARGGKPTSDQQRSDPWHIITWLTELRVKRIIIENVWEFTGWGPVDPKTGKPIPARKGEYFFAWIETLRRLGFDPEWKKLNAADYGDATTSQRFILMARSDRRQIAWPRPTHTKRPEQEMTLFPGLQPWRPARDIIDWNLKGRSILNRKKPLAPKTLARIYAGAVKFNWPEPYLIILRNHMGAQGLDLPLPTIAANGGHIGLAQPVIVNMKGRSTASDVDEPLPTQTAHAGHLFSAEPIVLSTNNSGTPKSADDPLPTITTGGAGSAGHYGCARPMLIEPFIATVAHGNSPGDRTADTRRVHSVDEPLGAMHAGGGAFAMVEPFVLSQASGGAPRSTDDPLPTIVTGGQQGSGTALIAPYYSSGSGDTCSSAEQPLPTVTTKGRLGMVVPVTHSQGGNGARDLGEPIPTLTTAKGGEFAVVMPVTHHDGSDRVRDANEPLPTVTGANRGELAFITAQHGERPGQAPRVHSVDDPAPTIAATGHVDLIEGADGYDILFRMLEPHELGPAMGFDGYSFAGNKSEQIKQIGNAVSVRKMKACVGALMADAVPRSRASARALRIAAE
jgi:DNA (cytosine-5)-methyltransferase 1